MPKTTTIAMKIQADVVITTTYHDCGDHSPAARERGSMVPVYHLNPGQIVHLSCLLPEGMTALAEGEGCGPKQDRRC